MFTYKCVQRKGWKPTTGVKLEVELMKPTQIFYVSFAGRFR